MLFKNREQREYTDDDIDDYEQDYYEDEELYEEDEELYEENDDEETQKRLSKFKRERRRKHKYDEGNEDYEEDEEDEEDATKKESIVPYLITGAIILSIVALFGTYFITKNTSKTFTLKQLSKQYMTNINEIDITKSELKDYIPLTYLEEVEVLRYRYSLDKLLEERSILLEDINTNDATKIEGFLDMTLPEQDKVIEDYKYKAKQNALLNNYLETLRNEANTTSNTIFKLNATKSQDGETISITLDSKNTEKAILEQLQTLNPTTSLHEITLNGTLYSTVMLEDKDVTYNYSNDVIIEAKQKLDMDLNNKMATLVITKKVEDDN